MPIKGIVNASNSKTLNVKIKSTSTKKEQTITASNLTLKVGDSKNINAKVSSGLPLTYKSANDSIATVDSTGKVVGRKAGTTKIIISQAGNSEYKPINKTITVTVNKSSSQQPTTPDITGIDYYQFNDVNKSKSCSSTIPILIRSSREYWLKSMIPTRLKISSSTSSE